MATLGRPETVADLIRVVGAEEQPPVGCDLTHSGHYYTAIGPSSFGTASITIRALLYLDGAHETPGTQIGNKNIGSGNNYQPRYTSACSIIGSSHIADHSMAIAGETSSIIADRCRVFAWDLDTDDLHSWNAGSSLRLVGGPVWRHGKLWWCLRDGSPTTSGDLYLWSANGDLSGATLVRQQPYSSAGIVQGMAVTQNFAHLMGDFSSNGIAKFPLSGEAPTMGDGRILGPTGAWSQQFSGAAVAGGKAVHLIRGIEDAAMYPWLISDNGAERVFNSDLLGITISSSNYGTYVHSAQGECTIVAPGPSSTRRMIRIDTAADYSECDTLAGFTTLQGSAGFQGGGPPQSMLPRTPEEE